MANRISKRTTVMSAKAANGVGTSINVADYQHIILQFGTASSANMTVKFQGSVSKDAPTFSSAATVSNHWDYVSVFDYESGSIIAGDTGIALSGTDDFRTLLVNVDGIEWINAEISSYVAGNATIVLVGYTNS